MPVVIFEALLLAVRLGIVIYRAEQLAKSTLDLVDSAFSNSLVSDDYVEDEELTFLVFSLCLSQYLRDAYPNAIINDSDLYECAYEAMDSNAYETSPNDASHKATAFVSEFANALAERCPHLFQVFDTESRRQLSDQQGVVYDIVPTVLATGGHVDNISRILVEDEYPSELVALVIQKMAQPMDEILNYQREIFLSITFFATVVDRYQKKLPPTVPDNVRMRMSADYLLLNSPDYEGAPLRMPRMYPQRSLTSAYIRSFRDVFDKESSAELDASLEASTQRKDPKTGKTLLDLAPDIHSLMTSSSASAARKLKRLQAKGKGYLRRRYGRNAAKLIQTILQTAIFKKPVFK